HKPAVAGRTSCVCEHRSEYSRADQRVERFRQRLWIRRRAARSAFGHYLRARRTDVHLRRPGKRSLLGVSRVASHSGTVSIEASSTLGCTRWKEKLVRISPKAREHRRNQQLEIRTPYFA